MQPTPLSCGPFILTWLPPSSLAHSCLCSCGLADGPFPPAHTLLGSATWEHCATARGLALPAPQATWEWSQIPWRGLESGTCVTVLLGSCLCQVWPRSSHSDPSALPLTRSPQGSKPVLGTQVRNTCHFSSISSASCCSFCDRNLSPYRTVSHWQWWREGELAKDSMPVDIKLGIYPSYKMKKVNKCVCVCMCMHV